MRIFDSKCEKLVKYIKYKHMHKHWFTQPYVADETTLLVHQYND